MFFPKWMPHLRCHMPHKIWHVVTKRGDDRLIRDYEGGIPVQTPCLACLVGCQSCPGLGPHIGTTREPAEGLFHTPCLSRMSGYSPGLGPHVWTTREPVEGLPGLPSRGLASSANSLTGRGGQLTKGVNNIRASLRVNSALCQLAGGVIGWFVVPCLNKD